MVVFLCRKIAAKQQKIYIEGFTTAITAKVYEKTELFRGTLYETFALWITVGFLFPLFDWENHKAVHKNVCQL